MVYVGTAGIGKCAGNRPRVCIASDVFVLLIREDAKAGAETDAGVVLCSIASTSMGETDDKLLSCRDQCWS